MRVARDRRRDARSYCKGNVQLRLDDSGMETRAEMLDVSSNGFRLQHSVPDLQPGHVVRFQHRIFFGRARVMWTTLVGGRTHSGFQILRG